MLHMMSLDELVEELNDVCRRAEELSAEIEKRLARLEDEESGHSVLSYQGTLTLNLPPERHPGE